jgi:hypothetical protein
LWNKKAPAVAGAFLFVFRRFLRGYWENACFLGGVFVVKMWWIRGGSWSDMPSQMEGEKPSWFEDLFFTLFGEFVSLRTKSMKARSDEGCIRDYPSVVADEAAWGNV